MGMESTSIQACLNADNELTCQNFLGNLVMTSQGALKFSLQTMLFKAQAGNFNDRVALAIVMWLEKLSYTSLTVPSVQEKLPQEKGFLTSFFWDIFLIQFLHTRQEC